MTDIINTILYIWNYIWYGDWLQEDSREGFMVSWHPERGSHAAEMYQCHFTAGLKYSRIKPFLNDICTFSNLYSRLGLEHPKSHYIQISLSRCLYAVLFLMDFWSIHVCMSGQYKLYLYCCRSKSWTSYWSKTINIWINMIYYVIIL